MKRFLIYCCVGSGGMFLTALFGKFLNYDVQPTISSSGHCHALSTTGNWQNTSDINFIGEFWECNFDPSKKIFYTHVADIEQLRVTYPDIEFVIVNFELDDILSIAEMFVRKAWPDTWNQIEYNKWAGPDWPLYSSNNIEESEMIRNEIINDLSITRIKPWFDKIQLAQVDHVINFKTIMGIDDKLLIEKVADIVNKPATFEIQQFIKQYQQINQRLYFNE